MMEDMTGHGDAVQTRTEHSVAPVFIPVDGFDDAEDRIIDERDVVRCDEIHERYMRACREEGPARATHDAFASACADWLTWLDDDDFDPFDCDAEGLCALAVLMTDSLSSRDAFIMTLVGAPGRSTPDDYEGFAVHPHERGNASAMEHELNASFKADARPDVERIMRGIEICGRAAQIVPDRYAAHPLAVAAYGMWWVGDERAVETAVRSIAFDGGIRLAGIVLTALIRGVVPQWIAVRS